MYNITMVIKDQTGNCNNAKIEVLLTWTWYKTHQHKEERPEGRKTMCVLDRKGCHSNVLQTDGLTQQNLFLTVLEITGPCRTGSVSKARPFSGLGGRAWCRSPPSFSWFHGNLWGTLTVKSWSPLYLHLHRGLSVYAYVGPNLFNIKLTSHTGIRPIQWSQLNTSIAAPFPKQATFRISVGHNSWY